MKAQTRVSFNDVNVYDRKNLRAYIKKSSDELTSFFQSQAGKELSWVSVSFDMPIHQSQIRCIVNMELRPYGQVQVTGWDIRANRAYNRTLTAAKNKLRTLSQTQAKPDLRSLIDIDRLSRTA